MATAAKYAIQFGL